MIAVQYFLKLNWSTSITGECSRPFEFSAITEHFSHQFCFHFLWKYRYLYKLMEFLYYNIWPNFGYFVNSHHQGCGVSIIFGISFCIVTSVIYVKMTQFIIFIIYCVQLVLTFILILFDFIYFDLNSRFIDITIHLLQI